MTQDVLELAVIEHSLMAHYGFTTLVADAWELAVNPRPPAIRDWAACPISWP